MAQYSKRDLDDVPSSSGRDARKKPADVAELYPLPDGKYARLRFLPGVVSYGGHWVNTVNKEGKKTQFFVTCSAWSMESATRKGGNGVGHCPFCEQEAREAAAEIDPTKRTSRFGVDHFMNAVVRSKQKSKPEDAGRHTQTEKRTGVKEKDSDAWTPVFAVRLPNSVVRSLKDLKQLNVQEDENGDSKSFAISHEDYGRDVSVMKDKSKPAAQMYAVQMGETTPLTSAEKKYLLQPIDALMDFIPEDELRAEYDKWATKMGIKTIKKAASKAKPQEDDDEDLDDEDLDDDEEPPKKSAKKQAPSKSKSKAPVDEDEDEDDLDDDEDEDEPPKKSVKKPVIKKSKAADEDDDLDDDEDEPPKKSVKKPVVKKSKAPVNDDDDDDDEDEPPKKPVKPQPAKKRVVDDDEDDLDDDEDDDEPPKKSAKKPVVKKSKVEDDEDDLEDDEDEEEDEPPKKSTKKPASKPVTKAKPKKRVVDDDDEDDELS